MALLLTNFKQELPQGILTKGRDYFRNGYVVDLSLEEDGIWSAQVAGTDTYDVQIEQGSGGKLACTCTCPYDYGDYCKHVAAVLYAIEEAYPEYLDGKKPRKTGKKRETKESKLRAVIDATPDIELRDFLHSLAMTDRTLYNQIMLRFGISNTRENYTRMVKDALRTGRGEYGMIDYHGSGVAAQAVSQILDRAQDLLGHAHADEACSIYQTVIEALIEALPNADDSNGELGACVSNAIDGLRQCADRVSPVVRSALFLFCLQSSQEDWVNSMDWRWELLNVASTMLQTGDERTALFAALDDLDGHQTMRGRLPGGYISDYQLEKTAQIRLAVIQRLDGEKAAEAFIQAHLHMRYFRQLVIERSISTGDLSQAKSLALEGVKDAEQKRLPGLAAQYQKFLLTIAEQEGDPNAVVRYARDEFLHRGSETAYQQLKKAVPVAEWPSFLEALLKDIRHSDFREDLSAWVYHREGMWDRLLNLVRESTPIWLERYRSDLEKRFPAEMASVYETRCLRIIEQSGNRGGYKQAGEYLRRMRKLGQSARVETLKKELQAKYPKRRALLDVLRDV